MWDKFVHLVLYPAVGAHLEVCCHMDSAFSWIGVNI